MPKPPTSVMILSIIGIILGILGGCGMLFTVVIMYVPIGPPNPALTTLYSDTIYRVVMGVSIPLGLAATVWLVWCAIGSLRLKPWARRGMLIYAWFGLIHTILGGVFNLAYTFPKMMAAVPAGSGPAHAGAIGGLIGGTCGAFLGLIYPACVLYFFTRTNVCNAFKGIFPASPTNFPVIFPPDQSPQA